MEHLPAFLACLDEAAAAAGIVEDDLLFPIHLAADEACTNVIKHGYADMTPGPLTLGFKSEPPLVVVTIIDRAPTFNPSSAPAPVLEGDAASRPIGGLGWHFIREMMDEVRHEALPGGGNRLTLIKRLPTHTSPDA